MVLILDNIKEYFKTKKEYKNILKKIKTNKKPAESLWNEGLNKYLRGSGSAMAAVIQMEYLQPKKEELEEKMSSIKDKINADSKWVIGIGTTLWIASKGLSPC